MNPRDEKDNERAKATRYFASLNQLLLALNACRKMGAPSKKPSPGDTTYRSILMLLPNLNSKLDTELCITLRDLILNDHDMTQAQLDDIEKQLSDFYNKLLNIPPPDKIPSDDELRNINSFEYLRQLAHLIPISLRAHDGFNEVWKTCNIDCQYDYHYPYGNYYTNFLIALEKYIIENLKNYSPRNKKNLHELDDLINTIYMNPNFALQRAYLMIRDTIQNVRHTDHDKTSKTAQMRLTSSSATKRNYGENIDTPMGRGTTLQRLSAGAGPETKPMTITSQPSLVNFAYKSANQPQQLRFGTQGQVVDYNVDINPIFLQWLDYKARKAENADISKDKIMHVYFNNLSRVGGKAIMFDLKRKSREDAISNKLEAIEASHSNVAIITLPADKSMLDLKHISDAHTSALITGNIAFNKIIAIIEKNSTDPYTDDFYLSKSTSAKLFKTTHMPGIMRQLLNNSFLNLGFAKEDKLTSADQHAIFFHFLKYELPNYILENLKPDTFNFSCKDAIDRGGASSAYYNLIKSIELGKPLSQNEFECILHGAPVIVKGRTMNKHITFVWNAVDAYLEANKGKTNAHIPDWLFAWRIQHAIPHTSYYYTKKLEKYVTKHSPRAAELKIFSSGTGIGVERGKLADSLLTELKEYLAKTNLNNRKNKCSLTVSKTEHDSLHSDNLGQLINAMKDDNILTFRIDNSHNYTKQHIKK